MSVPSRSINAALSRLLLEGVSDAAVAFDGDGRLVLANRAAHDLLGDVEQFFREGPASEALSYVFGELAGSSRASSAARLRVADGSTRSLSLWGACHADYRVLVIRDLTEHMDVENELRLLRRMQSLGYMTASVVHDLNNMLTPVLCLASVLERQTSDPAQRKHAADISAAGQRAASLVGQVLAFLRRESSTPHRVNVADMVLSMKELVQRVLGDEVTLLLDLDRESGEAHLEPDQLEHILLNLAANARDAMPRGGTLVVRVERAPSDGRDDRGHGQVKISVTDDGEGIPEELQQQVFSPFFTTKGSLGLGLASVQRFVSRHRGTIAVSSHPGQGTTISILLPCAPPLRPTARPPAPEPDESEAPASVLVVDPDDSVRAAVRLALEDTGYHVIEAESAAAALDRGNDVDVVITDVALPDMSGVALVDRFREAGRRAKVILMSGQTQERLARHGFVDGKHPLLRKAFTAKALRQHVRAALAPADDEAQGEG